MRSGSTKNRSKSKQNINSGKKLKIERHHYLENALKIAPQRRNKKQSQEKQSQDTWPTQASFEVNLAAVQAATEHQQKWAGTE
jgi:hypothetical protein